METHIYNPATGEPVADIINHTRDDLFKAVEQARAAQKKWSAIPPKARGRIVYSLKNVMFNRREEIARLISRCTGKTFMDAYAVEVFSALLGLRYYCKTGWKVFKPKKIKGGNILFFNKKSMLYREPVGVVGIISPWNYALLIPFHEIIMALVAGNGVVLKVATQVQPVGDLLVELVKASQIPDHLFSVVHVPGKDAGPAFFQSGIGKLFFTGSVAVGKTLMAQAAETLTPVSLELGGNDPMIVYDDAHLQRAVFGALWAGFSNGGQSCGGVERILVQSGIYTAFKTEFVRQAKNLRIGFTTGQQGEKEIDMGSLTTPGQKRIVSDHLSDALEKGANIVFQSEPVPEGDLFHPAVLLENITTDMKIFKEESFGPVICLQPFETMEEAVHIANNSHLGLTASVWTTDHKKAEQTAALLETGTVSLNDHLMTHGMAETPWGGLKESGIGRTHSFIGLEEMTEPKTVVKDRLPSIPRNIWWHPYSESVFDGLDGAARFLFGPDKLKGLLKLLPLYLKRLLKV